MSTWSLEGRLFNDIAPLGDLAQDLRKAVDSNMLRVEDWLGMVIRGTSFDAGPQKAVVLPLRASLV